MFCQKCGCENSGIARFCRSCGAELAGVPHGSGDIYAQNSSVPQNSPSVSLKSKHDRKTMTAVVVLVAAVGVAAILFIIAGGFGGGGKGTLSDSKKYYNKGDYDNAMLCFQMIEDADYSSEYYMDLCYKVAEDWYNDGQYEEALEWYEKINAGKCSFDDVEERILEAKYGYVEDNFYNYNETTYKYLKLLKEEDYKDCRDLYDELYTWKTEIITNKTESDNSSDYSSFSKGSYIYFHVKLLGGTPGQKIWPKYTVTYPSGSTGNGEWDTSYGNASNIWVRVNPGSTGTLTVRIYDAGDNFIGKKSVTVTS